MFLPIPKARSGVKPPEYKALSSQRPPKRLKGSPVEKWGEIA